MSTRKGDAPDHPTPDALRARLAEGTFDVGELARQSITVARDAIAAYEWALSEKSRFARMVSQVAEERDAAHVRMWKAQGQRYTGQ